MEGEGLVKGKERGGDRESGLWKVKMEGVGVLAPKVIFWIRQYERQLSQRSDKPDRYPVNSYQISTRTKSTRTYVRAFCITDG